MKAKEKLLHLARIKHHNQKESFQYQKMNSIIIMI